MKSLYIKKGITLIALFVLSNVMSGQSSIQLLGAENNFPIIGAHYWYGEEEGVSDQEGFINILKKDDLTLVLSHLTYGKREIDADELAKIVETSSVILWKEKNVNLQPVTVVAVRPITSGKQDLSLGYAEKLVHDGGSLLANIPGIQVIRKSGSYGFDPVFRGFKYDQLNIVQDGIQSATAACPNRMDPASSQMAPNMLDNVELLKGPYALRYGNTIGGTVMFNSPQMNYGLIPGWQGRFSQSYETNGNVIRNELMGGYSSGKIAGEIYGAFSSGNDYTSGNGEEVQADFTRYSLGGKLGAKLSPAQEVQFSVMNNIAKDADFPALPMDLRSDNTLMLQAMHRWSTARQGWQSVETRLSLTTVDHLMDNGLKLLDPRMLDARTDAKTNNYGLRSEARWSKANQQLYLGIDAREESAEGIRERRFLLGPNTGKILQDNAWQKANIRRSSAFAEYSIYSGNIKYVASARIEHNDANADATDATFEGIYNETSKASLNPAFSLGLNYQLDKAQSIGLWMARTQRSGSLAERYINFFPIGLDPYEMVGNPELNPEVLYQTDVVYAYNTNQISWNINLFYGKLSDAISSRISPALSPRIPSSPGVRTFVNIEEALYTGGEFGYRHQLSDKFTHSLDLAYTYGQDKERDESLPEIPPLELQYAIKARFMHGKLLPGLQWRQVWSQDRISREYGESKTPGFQVLDLKLHFNYEKFRIGIMALNVLDETYYEHLSRGVRGTQSPIYNPGRSFVLNFGLHLHK